MDASAGGVGGAAGSTRDGAAGTPLVRPLPAVDVSGARCSGDGWCWVNPGPVGSALDQPLVLADDAIIIGGEGGTVLRFDGKQWHRMNAGTHRRIMAVAGSGPNDVWVFPLVEAPRRWDGTRWTVTPNGPTWIRAAWAFAPDEVWAAGGSGEIFTWDGVRWTKGPANIASRATLSHMWAASRNDVWVAGEMGSVARWRGTSWETVKIPSSAHVESLWGTGANDVWLRTKDATGNLFHFDGQTWAAHGGDPNGAETLILGPAGPARMVALRNGTELLLREQGRWRHLGTRPSAPGLVRAIAGSHPDHVWIMGTWGLLERFDGTNVQRYIKAVGVGVGFPVRFERILGTGPNDVWFLGNQWWRWDGQEVQTPTITPPPFHRQGILFGQDQTLWMAFRDSYDWHLHPWTGTAVGARRVSVPRGTDPQAAWTNGTDAVVVLDGSNSRTWDGQAWIGGGAPGPVMWGEGTTHLWSLKPGEGSVWERSSSGWKQHFGGQRAFRALHGSARNNVWVVGDYGEVHQFDGNRWTPRPIPMSGQLLGVLARAPDDVFVVGAAGTLLHWDGLAWRQMEAGVDTDLYAVWSDGAGGVWVVGADAKVLRRTR